jgi:hypothetical protein
MEGLVWEASGVSGCLTRVTGVAGASGEPGDQGVSVLAPFSRDRRIYGCLVCEAARYEVYSLGLGREYEMRKYSIENSEFH